MKYGLVIVVVVCAVFLQQYAECKRSGGGRSRGSSGRSTGLWGSNAKKKGSGSGNPPAKPAPNPDSVALSYPKQTGSLPANKPKPSAPKLENQRVQKPVSNEGNQKPIGFDNVNKPAASAPGSNVQTNQQKPIGWNVPNQPGQGQVQTKTLASNQNNAAPGYGHGQGAPPPYSPSGSYGQGAPPPAYSAGSYGQGAPPAYSAGGYGQGAPPAYSAGGYGHAGAPPAYSAGGYGQSGHGHNYPSGQAPPNYGQTYNGRQNPGYGGYGGQGGYGMNGGHAGYGGMGGYGGGMGGYGGMGGFGGGLMGQKRSFGSGFATTAFTSLATGLLVWSLMRGGRSQYYNVYNHDNHPEAVPQEIALPANVITLCAENANLLCAPNTVPLCTANETIMCAVTAAATIPCVDNAGASCVDTSVPGGDKENATLPCIANATVSGQVNLKDGNQNTMNLFKQTPQNSDTVLCVTTMAMPSPEEEKAAEAAIAAMQANSSTQMPLVQNLNIAPNESTTGEPSIEITSTVESTTS